MKKLRYVILTILVAVTNVLLLISLPIWCGFFIYYKMTEDLIKIDRERFKFFAALRGERWFWE